MGTWVEERGKTNIWPSYNTLQENKVEVKGRAAAWSDGKRGQEEVFLTALLTITHVTYNKINIQEEMKYICKVI